MGNPSKYSVPATSGASHNVSEPTLMSNNPTVYDTLVWVSYTTASRDLALDRTPDALAAGSCVLDELPYKPEFQQVTPESVPESWASIQVLRSLYGDVEPPYEYKRDFELRTLQEAVEASEWPTKVSDVRSRLRSFGWMSTQHPERYETGRLWEEVEQSLRGIKDHSVLISRDTVYPEMRDKLERVKRDSRKPVTEDLAARNVQGKDYAFSEDRGVRALLEKACDLYGV